MNRTLAIALLGAGLLVVGMVRADASKPAAYKIGFVDLQRTIQETPPGKAARKKLEQDKTRKQKELDKRRQQVEKQHAELEKQRMVLKPDVLRQREQELQQKYIELQETYFKLQQELAANEAKLVNEILGKASPIIQRIAKRDGYTLIFDRSSVLWAAESLDITGEVNRQIK